MTFAHTIGGTHTIFATLRELPARATAAPPQLAEDSLA